MRKSWEVWATVFTATALLFLAFPSAFYNFDGVACAIAVELGDLGHLVHGNHLAYGLVALAFDRLWRLLGYHGPAILALNALSMLLGAATAAVFASTLLRLKVRPGLVLLCSMGLAVSQAFWFWSLEAQVYPLGVFFLVLAAREALAEKPRPIAVGLLQAGAVLGHVGHVMFVPAALYLLKRGGAAAWRRDALRYAAALFAAIGVSYALAALLCLHPRSAEELKLWLLGSAALKVDRSFTWYGGYSPADLGEWLKMSARIFCEPGNASGWPRAAGVALALLALAAAGCGAFAAENRRAAKASLLWLAGYAVLFASWQPFTVVYRISDLPALWLLIALAAQSRVTRFAAAALAAWLAAAFAFNLRTEILPRADPANNAPYQESVWLGLVTPPQAWVAVSGMGQVYVPYFSHRRPLNLRYFEDRPGSLAQRLDALAAAGEPVFVTSTTLGTSVLRGEFESYGLSEVARRPSVALYRVKKKESRGAKAGRS